MRHKQSGFTLIELLVV
ncbi:MAG: type II secretion system protein, partial [Armatimonadetes bacterium]|nr:type II secretion system protein [Armatimonadota bacterium]